MKDRAVDSFDGGDCTGGERLQDVVVGGDGGTGVTVRCERMGVSLGRLFRWGVGSIERIEELEEKEVQI